eukprot:6191623-Pleurochrysis_carterae.AAC.1
MLCRHVGLRRPASRSYPRKKGEGSLLALGPRQIWAPTLQSRKEEAVRARLKRARRTKHASDVQRPLLGPARLDRARERRETREGCGVAQGSAMRPALEAREEWRRAWKPWYGAWSGETRGSRAST